MSTQSTSAERAAERIETEVTAPLMESQKDDIAAIIKEETAIERTAWEQREKQLVEALKYARRFLNSTDHDTAYIDAALTPPTGDTPACRVCGATDGAMKMGDGTYLCSYNCAQSE